MDRRTLENLLNEVFVPRGYRKKGSWWRLNGDEITTLVNLQKSRFSNRYYVNYGFILAGLPLAGCTMHIYRGMGSLDAAENERIKELLDLENAISDADRAAELRQHLVAKVVATLDPVNTEADLLAYLRNRPHLKDVPIDVLRHFGLEQ